MKKDSLYITHILNAIKDIERYTADTHFDLFAKNTLLQDGVMRKLEIIGEAAKRLSPEFCNATMDVPWKDICGMRDKLVHDYFGIDLVAVWKTATEDLGILKAVLEASQAKEAQIVPVGETNAGGPDSEVQSDEAKR